MNPFAAAIVGIQYRDWTPADFKKIWRKNKHTFLFLTPRTEVKRGCDGPFKFLEDAIERGDDHAGDIPIEHKILQFNEVNDYLLTVSKTNKVGMSAGLQASVIMVRIRTYPDSKPLKKATAEWRESVALGLRSSLAYKRMERLAKTVINRHEYVWCMIGWDSFG